VPADNLVIFGILSPARPLVNPRPTAKPQGVSGNAGQCGADTTKNKVESYVKLDKLEKMTAGQ